MRSTKHVCVIGAGPSGLVSARELKKEGHSVRVFEQNHDVGGQWLYESNVNTEDAMGKINPLKVHSSIYDSLRLVTPREIMGFTDFPFVVKKGRDMRRFPGHKEMLFYLQDFCKWFQIREMIRFSTRVEYVGMEDDSMGDISRRWVVRTKDLETGVIDEEIFDAVVVANGHYSVPRLPIIEGMNSWTRKQLHSHVYRVPEPFTNEVVVVVGNAMSGQDISIELAKFAKEVHLSSKSLEISKGLSKVLAKHENMHLQSQIDTLYEEGKVLFVDGTCITADTIIYCTGYSYSLPFLDTKGIVTIDDDRVGPLYEHTFPPAIAPSLTFVGIPRKILGFPYFESQAKWIAQLLSGKRTLPPPEEMMKATMEYYHSQDQAGLPKHKTHDVASFEYCDKNGAKCEEWRKDICLSTIINAQVNLETYRDSWNDNELLEEALQSFHYADLGNTNSI